MLVKLVLLNVKHVQSGQIIVLSQMDVIEDFIITMQQIAVLLDAQMDYMLI